MRRRGQVGKHAADNRIQLWGMFCNLQSARKFQVCAFQICAQVELASHPGPRGQFGLKVMRVCSCKGACALWRMCTLRPTY